MGIALEGIVNFLPSSLASFYGSRTPLGGLIFLRLRPYHISRSTQMMMDMTGM
jgi:hypothetical protein